MKDLTAFNSWHSDWRNLRVGVIGLGVSGFSVADTLAELGATQLVIAQSALPEQLDILDVLGVAYLVGPEAAPAGMDSIPPRLVELEPDVLITSPGVRPDSPLILWAEQNGIPVWVDIDLAWRLRDKTDSVADWLCITGTNGKTTTTQLVEAMLHHGGLRAMACGNIGTPILDAIRDPEGLDALVVELSSFQLHYLGEIYPHSSAVLNVADDHLDWHGGFENYAATKGKVYQNVLNACVFNVADQMTERLVEAADVQEGARAIGFTLGAPGRSMIGYVEDILVDRAFLEDRSMAIPVAELSDIAQIGVITPHLLANVAAATALARAMDVTPLAIKAALLDFRLDNHRIQLVAEADQISWYDDSKATNPHAAAASLASFDSVIWILGGLLKGVDVTSLIERNKTKLRAAVVIGADRQPILDAFAAVAPNVSVLPVDQVQNSLVMRDAVALAAKMAMVGDTVLLAPAAASMDQFKDYADRGNQFAAEVRSWLENQQYVGEN
jgi:UDP-N-acetylmuramoylalanine--D-glutamate ligase